LGGTCLSLARWSSIGQRHWARAGWPGNGDAGLVDEVGDGVATLQGTELMHLGTKERERRRVHLPAAIRDLVLDDQQRRSAICWHVFELSEACSSSAEARSGGFGFAGLYS
jgi:hypothetical protein